MAYLVVNCSGQQARIKRTSRTIAQHTPPLPDFPFLSWCLRLAAGDDVKAGYNLLLVSSGWWWPGDTTTATNKMEWGAEGMGARRDGGKRTARWRKGVRRDRVRRAASRCKSEEEAKQETVLVEG
jgi:hypothetical protein